MKTAEPPPLAWVQVYIFTFVLTAVSRAHLHQGDRIFEQEKGNLNIDLEYLENTSDEDIILSI